MKTIRSSKANDQDSEGDIYSTYQPRPLTTSRIRENKREINTVFDELISKMAGNIPFNQDLVKKLENLKASSAKKDIAPMILEKVEIILYFNRYGISPVRSVRLSPKDMGGENWKSLLECMLGEFPIYLCNKRADVLSRTRCFLAGLFNEKGKIPDSSDKETISIFNAILRGGYKKMGILTWDDLMFMTFGRNYFKFKLDMKRNHAQEEEESLSSCSFFRSKKREVLSLAQWYKTALSLDDALQEEISDTFDLLYRYLPKGSILKKPSIMAEIIIFHVLKEGKRFTDWDLFVLVSPLGSMPMWNRTWLLRYKQYLPSKKVYFTSAETPDLYLKKVYETTKVTEKIKAECEKNKLVLVKNFKCIKPRTIAGIACYLALKNNPERSCNISETLGRMGIENPGSIINAVKRLKERREYSDELFK